MNSETNLEHLDNILQFDGIIKRRLLHHLCIYDGYCQ